MRVTIAEGATKSSAIDLSQSTFTALLIPNGFTGATITFEASVDGETWKAVVDDTGAAVSITARRLAGRARARWPLCSPVPLPEARLRGAEGGRTILFSARPR